MRLQGEDGVVGGSLRARSHQHHLSHPALSSDPQRPLSSDTARLEHPAPTPRHGPRGGHSAVCAPVAQVVARNPCAFPAVFHAVPCPAPPQSPGLRPGPGSAPFRPGLAGPVQRFPGPWPRPRPPGPAVTPPAPPLGRLRAGGRREWGSPRAGSGGGSFCARGEELPHAGRLRRRRQRGEQAARMFLEPQVGLQCVTRSGSGRRRRGRAPGQPLDRRRSAVCGAGGRVGVVLRCHAGEGVRPSRKSLVCPGESLSLKTTSSALSPRGHLLPGGRRPGLRTGGMAQAATALPDMSC